MQQLILVFLFMFTNADQFDRQKRQTPFCQNGVDRAVAGCTETINCHASLRCEKPNFFCCALPKCSDGTAAAADCSTNSAACNSFAGTSCQGGVCCKTAKPGSGCANGARSVMNCYPGGKCFVKYTKCDISQNICCPECPAGQTFQGLCQQNTMTCSNPAHQCISGICCSSSSPAQNCPSGVASVPCNNFGGCDDTTKECKPLGGGNVCCPKAATQNCPTGVAAVPCNNFGSCDDTTKECKPLGGANMCCPKASTGTCPVGASKGACTSDANCQSISTSLRCTPQQTCCAGCPTQNEIPVACNANDACDDPNKECKPRAGVAVCCSKTAPPQNTCPITMPNPTTCAVATDCKSASLTCGADKKCCPTCPSGDAPVPCNANDACDDPTKQCLPRGGVPVCCGPSTPPATKCPITVANPTTCNLVTDCTSKSAALTCSGDKICCPTCTNPAEAPVACNAQDACDDPNKECKSRGGIPVCCSKATPPTSVCAANAPDKGACTGLSCTQFPGTTCVQGRCCPVCTVSGASVNPTKLCSQGCTPSVETCNGDICCPSSTPPPTSTCPNNVPGGVTCPAQPLLCPPTSPLCVKGTCCPKQGICPTGDATDVCSPTKPCATGVCTPDGICCSVCPANTADTGSPCNVDADCGNGPTCVQKRCCADSTGCPAGQLKSGPCTTADNNSWQCTNGFTCSEQSANGVCCKNPSK